MVRGESPPTLALRVIMKIYYPPDLATRLTYYFRQRRTGSSATHGAISWRT